MSILNISLVITMKPKAKYIFAWFTCHWLNINHTGLVSSLRYTELYFGLLLCMGV